MSGLFDKMLTPAKVIGVNRWQPETFVEIEIRSWELKLEKWRTVHGVKCRVADLEYRDYTPAQWDIEKGTFKLYVEAGHDGAGSRWAQQIKAGDDILLGAVHAAPIPSKKGKVLCLADLSALGHVLSLKQLMDRSEFPLEAGIFLHEEFDIPAPLRSENPEFEFLYRENDRNVEVLERWMLSKNLADYESVCIAGNNHMVSHMRKKLKTIPEFKGRILVQGFWW